MNDAKLLVNFPAANVRLLYEDWSWLVNQADLDRPIAMTTFGDLFFKKQDGHVYLLDTLEGTVIDFANDENELQNKLNHMENQEQYLFSSLVKTLQEKGLALKENELYIFKVHPIVGGEAISDNVEAMSMRVVISLLGQLHRHAAQR